MCSCGHGVTAMASAASTPPALQLRQRLCALPSTIPPSLLLPARILHSGNSAAARCSWSRISSPLLATPREDVTSRQQESSLRSSSQVHQQQHQEEEEEQGHQQQQQQHHHHAVASGSSNGAAVRVDRGANELHLVHDAPTNGAVNGAANGNSRPVERQDSGRQLVEEFLFSQAYLESLDYDSPRNGAAVVDRGVTSPRGRSQVMVKSDPSVSEKRVRPKLASTNVVKPGLKRVKKGGRVLPATIAEVLPVKPETSMKFYIDLYAALLRAGRIKDCLVLLGEMDKAGKLSLMKVNHSKFYEACKTRGSVEDGLAFVKIMRIYSTLQHYTMLLGVCSHFKDVDGGLRVLALLESRGFKADCMFYTTLISACAKAGKVDLLFQIFHEMELHDVEANVRTFGAMIDGCARAGQLPKAFGAYGIMMSKGVKADRVIFNTLVNACSRAGAVQRAFDVLSDMKSEATPVKPDHVTYGALISACARGGEVDRALEVYQSMRKDNVKGSPACFTAAVHACSQKGDLDYALSVYEDLKKDGVKPDEVFFSALIDVAGHSKDIDKAFSILDNMKKSGIKPGAVVYSSLMGVCSNLGDWEKALELYKVIRSSRVRPTVSTFNALMTALCEGTQLDKALSILKDLKKTGTMPNQISYSILLQACEKEANADMALDLFMNARAEGIKPNVIICDSIIGLCLQQIQTSAAAPQISLTMLPPADSSNIPAKDQWLTWALAIYRQTIEAGALPTIETLSRLLGCLRKPEISASTATSFEDRVLTFFGQPPSPHQTPAPVATFDVLDGFGIYDPRALSLFEEASALKIAPTFNFVTLQPIHISAESMPVFAAEVCLLTVLKGIKQRHAAGNNTLH
ncbi:hypothetical protein KC19_4G225700 [Ceratodon purpureus]|uniref:Pentacotripeptide-repeat region of PRORP domain-containing protein n=1 Tax=Ceratodon purpureus TaxID=3225 RepID=A0A8T0IBK0_CERPU|nr:hypothetical protein KC19_4G225700 [Ceratodon purpureus]KAG0581113.1 hypothetical protein KC19_4G225700 [Ceratodon purpureus]